MRLYYVRHGLTDWNVAGRLQGHRDVPLNGIGRAQALQCASLLGDLFERDRHAAGSFGYVSSPLVRARETMEIMRAALGLDATAYITDERLTEIGFGQRNARRTAIDHAADRGPVALAKGRNAKQVTERIE